MADETEKARIKRAEALAKHAHEAELARRNAPPDPDAIPTLKVEKGSLLPGNLKVG